MPSRALAPQQNKVRPLSNTLRRCSQNFSHHVSRAFQFGEILVGGTGLRLKIGVRMASCSSDLTQNLSPKVPLALQRACVSCVALAACFTLRFFHWQTFCWLGIGELVSCVAPAACFSVNNWTLKPFSVDCMILWRHRSDSLHGSIIESANPSEFCLITAHLLCHTGGDGCLYLYCLQWERR